MASGQFEWYGQAIMNLYNNNINLSTDDLYVMLTTSTYVPDKDTHATGLDLSNEVSGTGYDSGGKLLTHSLSYDAVSSHARILANDVVWATSTITAARCAVIYALASGATTSYLLGYAVFNADKSSEGGDFALDFDNVNGILYVDVSEVV